jgi:hypothetical protein
MFPGSAPQAAHVTTARSFSIAVSLLLSCTTALASAQTTDTARAADRYERVIDGLRRMTQVDRVAPVRNVTLRRDAIAFHLDEGNVFLATPVGGRTIGAAFVGRGSVSYTPPLAVERGELHRLLEDSTVDARISAAAFVFSDSTLTELERQLTFGPRLAASQGSDILGAFVRLAVRGPVTEVTLDLPAEPKRLELNPLESVLADVKEEAWN